MAANQLPSLKSVFSFTVYLLVVLCLVYVALQRYLPAGERKGERESMRRDGREGRGSVEGKQAAPAFFHVKPLSCSGLILPECGGGTLEVMFANQAPTAMLTTIFIFQHCSLLRNLCQEMLIYEF